MTQTPSLKTQQMQVGGMDCTGCKMKIEGSLERIKGVDEASVVVATGRLTVSYDPQQVSEAQIQDRIKALGYTIEPTQSPAPTHDQAGHNHKHDQAGHSHQYDGYSHDDGHEHRHSSSEGHDHGHSHGSSEFDLKAELLPVLAVIVLFGLGIVFEERLHNTPYSIAEYAVFIPAYLLSGWTVLKAAGRNILRGQVFDENFLMTIATLGAFAIHQLPEAVAVMLFFRIGELFQEYSVGRSRRSIKALLEVRPDSANLKIAGTTKASTLR